MKIHKQIFRIIFTILITGLVLPSPVFAEQQTANNFLIKLKSNELSALSSVATNVEQKFTFSTNPQFQNIYSFSSKLDANKLKQKLAGSFEYLEQNQILQTHAQITPNDPGFTLNPLNIDKQWGLAKQVFRKFGTKKKVLAKLLLLLLTRE